MSARRQPWSDESLARYDGNVRTSVVYPKFRDLIGYKRRILAMSNKYLAFPSQIFKSGSSLVAIYSEGDAHAASDRQIMVRSDDKGRTWQRAVFFEDVGSVYDFSLLTDLMSNGDVVFFKTWTITKTAGVCSAVINNLNYNTSNVLAVTGDYENAAWTKAGNLAFGSGSVANTTDTTDPSGGNNADKFVFTAGTSARTISQTIAAAGADVERIWCVDFKLEASGAVNVALFMLAAGATSNFCAVWLSLSTLAVGTKSVGGNGVITDAKVYSLGNGWVRAVLRGHPNNVAGAGTTFLWRPTSGTSGSSNFTSNGVNGIYVANGQGTTTDTPLVVAHWSKTWVFGGNYYRTGYSATSETDWRAWLLRSTDAGQTFTVYSKIAQGLGLQLGETDIVIAANGDWVAMIREESQPGVERIYTCTSTDAGVTWGAATLTAMSGVQPNLLKLANDDILFLTGDRVGFTGIYPSGALNLINADVTGVRAYLSQDNGATWTGGAQIGHIYSTDGGQPVAVETDSGTVISLSYVRMGIDQEPGIHCTEFQPEGLAA